MKKKITKETSNSNTKKKKNCKKIIKEKENFSLLSKIFQF
jgi:hypothetical protein